jgi:hypothetical protein
MVPTTVPYQATRTVAFSVPYQATRMVPTTVPYQATRTVAVCVPYQETVMVTRLVPRQVERQVPVDACEAGVGGAVYSDGFSGGFDSGRGGLFGHHRRGGCN